MSVLKYSLAALSIVTLAACDSPTGAGLNLAGGQTGNPVSFTVPPTSFVSGDVDDITGGSSRVLAGDVSDPLLGTTEAAGYIDFLLESALPANFAAGPVTSARLLLPIDYLYGDTTVAPLLSISDMDEEWQDDGVTSDTTLTSGALVTQVAFSPSDSIFAVDMPAAWIAANDTTLRSVFFNSTFNGFELTMNDAGLLAGFDASATRLEVISGGDTLSLNVDRTVSSINKTAPAALPADRLLIQDGARIGALVDIDHTTTDSLEKAILSKTSLTVFSDTTLTDATPAGFVRPRVTSLELIGTTESGLDVQIRIIEMDDEGRFVFQADLFRDALQQQIAGNTLFIEYVVRVPVADNTVSGVVLYAPSAPEFAPRLNVTASLFE